MDVDSAQTIEQVLLSQKLITENQLETVNQEKLKGGVTAEEILLQNHFVTKSDIAKAKGQIIGVPFIDPTQLAYKPEVIKMVPEATARKYTLIPIDKDDVFLSIAMSDPEDLLISQFLSRSTGLRIKAYISTPELINSAIDAEYSKSLGEGVSVAIEQAAASSTMRIKETLKNIDQAEDIIKVSPVAEIVSVLLEYAVKSQASDIHIEPFENGTRIRYRIDGVLQEKFPLPKAIHDSIVARIKILADMPIDERRKPLDGKFKVVFGDTRTDLRVSTLPTMYGEKVVIRLLKDQKRIFTFKELGLWGRARHVLNETLKQTTGIVFVTGPTGSGKTVTQATSLSKLNKIGVNIVTLEDPVEIAIAGVNQAQINTKAGLTFANGLRSILRQDPNIIMVGEVRDGETAQLAIQAALTGHLVLATLHTNSAAGAIPRLIDMGIEPFLIASTLNIALAQRLARRICPHCKEEFIADEPVKKDMERVLGENLIPYALGPSPFGDEDGDIDDEGDWEKEMQVGKTLSNKSGKIELPKDFKLYRGKGCDRCNHTGYKGRMGLYEVMDINSEIKALTEKSSNEDSIESAAIRNGMITLIQDGFLKAAWGITSLEEVLTVTDENNHD